MGVIQVVPDKLAKGPKDVRGVDMDKNVEIGGLGIGRATMTTSPPFRP